MGLFEKQQRECLCAAGWGRPSKREVEECIDILLAAREVSPTTQQLIGLLWLYFEKPIKRKADNSNAHWVAQVHTGGERPSIQYLFYKSGLLVGADGHRIHIAWVDMDEPGFYDPVMFAPVVNKGQMFPPYQRFIDDKPKLSQGIELRDFLPEDRYTVSYNGVKFNRQFIREAFAGSTAMFTQEKYVFGTLDNVNFLYLEPFNGKRLAVIAPLRA